MKPGLSISTLLLAIPAALCGLQGSESAAAEEPAALEAFDFGALVEELRESGGSWERFLDRPSMYLGVYRLPAGATDGQSPHDEDEVYFVVKGKGALVVDGERTTAEPGAILFVAAGAEHRFVEITEDLELLVFFARGATEVREGR